jgi:release factor glutamine methyltransferase
MAETQAEAWTVGRLLTWTTDYLRERGAESPRLDAELLLAKVLGCERIALYTRFDELAGDSIRKDFRELVQRRAAGAPVAYLVGHKEFFSIDFEVSPDVLIPRPDSEFVVLEFLRLTRDLPVVTAIDVGTGSGNLAIASARQHPGARFWAIDASRNALQVAQRNAERHGVLDRMVFLEGNLFDALPEGIQVDCMLSNPPYIPSGDIAHLPIGVRDYEPHTALDGGPTGLECVGQIVARAGRYLKLGGSLILEIGAPQELAVRQLIQDQLHYELRPTIHDYAGHARVISARWNPGALGPPPGKAAAAGTEEQTWRSS